MAAIVVASAACGPRTPPPAPCTAPPSSINSATRAELVAARDAVWRAYYAGDSAALTRLLPEQMTGMGESRADIIRDAQEFARDGRLLAIEFRCDEFFVSGDVAVVFSHYRADVEKSGKRTTDAGRAIELFERRAGVWVNPSWHLDEER